MAISLKRYPGYRGTPGLAERIEFRVYEERDCFPDLERGLIDVCAVAASDFHAAKKEFSDRLLQRQSFLFNSIHVPLYDRRFRNEDIRQALSLAVDRAAVSEEVYQGTATPATSVFPLPVEGHRDDACSYCRLDVPTARQKLEDSGWKGTLDLFCTTDTVRLRAAQAVAEAWRRNLGIDVAVHPLKYDELLDRGSRRAHTGPFWDSTTLDASPENWLESLYQTGSELNWTGYSNPEVDRLIAAGKAASTPSEAVSDYQRAEDIILEELPLIPLWYPELYIAYSDRLRGVMLLSDGEVALDRVQVVG